MLWVSIDVSRGGREVDLCGVVVDSMGVVGSSASLRAQVDFLRQASEARSDSDWAELSTRYNARFDFDFELMYHRIDRNRRIGDDTEGLQCRRCRQEKTRSSRRRLGWQSSNDRGRSGRRSSPARDRVLETPVR